MDLTALSRSLAGTPFSGKLHHYSTIDSTNNHALREAAAGAPSYSVYLADEQIAGRGRGAHSWHSEPGNGLYVSILLRPKLSAQDSLWISLAAGLAAHDAVAELANVEPDLRWPNDLMIAECGISKKFGGILVETQTDGDNLRHAVVGIGINLNQTEFPPEIAAVATSVRLATGQEQSREALLLALLLAFHGEMISLETKIPRGAGIVPRMESASTWVRGKRVRVIEGEDSSNGFEGTTAGLDARGFLLVNTLDGRRTVVSGSVRETTDALTC